MFSIGWKSPRPLAAALAAPVAALGLFGAGSAFASTGSRTLYVGPGQSIQAAIDRAQPGDTVSVAPGVYREQLTTMR